MAKRALFVGHKMGLMPTAGLPVVMVNPLMATIGLVGHCVQLLLVFRWVKKGMKRVDLYRAG